MLKKLLFLSIFFPFSLIFSQKTIGKVYNSVGTLQDVYVQNITQGEAQYTTETGNFSLHAEVGDSLVFSAPFYTTQNFKIKAYQLEEVWVVELKESMNELDEVLLSNKKLKEIDITETSAGILKSFQEDYKANPGKYGVGPKGNVGWIVGKVIGLFKNKNAKGKVGFVTDEQLLALFKTDSLFNEKLLTKQFEIPQEYHKLFLEYSTAQSIDGHLLEKEKHFLLLDRLVNYSEDFRELLRKAAE